MLAEGFVNPLDKIDFKNLKPKIQNEHLPNTPMRDLNEIQDIFDETYEKQPVRLVGISQSTELKKISK